MVKIISNHPTIERRESGLYTLDHALGQPDRPGLPLRSIYEIYGDAHSGKSSLVYYLSGRIAPNDGVIALADIEGVDQSYFEHAFGAYEGTLKVIDEYDDKGKPRYHGAMLTELARGLGSEYNVGIFDSISSYASAAEDEGTIGEAFMGRRARDMAQFLRKSRSNLLYNETPGALFLVNHKYAVLGSAGAHTTAGGLAPQNLSAVRVWLYRKESIIKTADQDDYYAEGRVMKLRYGGKGRKFGVCFLSGRGVHPGLTALFDCFRLEIASRGATVKIGKTSHGRLSTLVAAARAGDEKPFEPFYEALQNFDGTIQEETEDE